MNEVPCLIVIPARNEEETIVEAISHVKKALHEARQKGFLVVVCDSCTDRTRDLAASALRGTEGLVIEAAYENVGAARDWGTQVGLEYFPETRWVAFTDADTYVDPDWLSRQVTLFNLGWEAYFGRVAFDATTDLLRKFAEAYHLQTHKRVHGANMGLSRLAYQKAGGVPRLSAHEDRVLSEILDAAGSRIYWDETPTVKTSIRMEGRAPEGFAVTLNRFAQANVLAI